MLVGIAFAEPRAVGLGIASIVHAVWLLFLTRRLATLTAERTVTNIASVTLALIAIAAVLEQTVAMGLAIAALIPGVLVLPFLGSRGVGRVLAMTGVGATARRVAIGTGIVPG